MTLFMNKYLPWATILGCGVMGLMIGATMPVSAQNTQSRTPAKPVSSPAQAPKQEPTAAALIQQGKAFYRTVRLKLAQEKFEAALKLEPENDEALGLAAVTAFRLDNQKDSRAYFLRRAELPQQKDSVKAFCYYRVALTFWREVHDLVAMHGRFEDGRLVYRLPEQAASDVVYLVTSGLDYVDRTLAIIETFAEAYNIRNLLHAEAALAETNPDKAAQHRQLAIAALTRAVELAEQPTAPKKSEVADFSQPTMRISEYARTPEEESIIDDPMMKLLDGGRPLKRQSAVFPQPKPVKGEATEPAGPGPQNVKVEVLISALGDVAFAHVVDGKPEFGAAALLAARGWKFEPARFEGRPVQVSGVITFEVKSSSKPR